MATTRMLTDKNQWGPHTLGAKEMLILRSFVHIKKYIHDNNNQHLSSIAAWCGTLKYHSLNLGAIYLPCTLIFYNETFGNKPICFDAADDGDI